MKKVITDERRDASAETDKKLVEMQRRLLAAQSELEQTFTEARFTLMQAQEELKTRGDEAERARFENYTEPEAAAVLKISESTLRRLRTSIPNFPHWRARDLVRYTNLDLIEITELLREREARRSKGVRRA